MSGMIYRENSLIEHKNIWKYIGKFMKRANTMQYTAVYFYSLCFHALIVHTSLAQS